MTFTDKTEPVQGSVPVLTQERVSEAALAMKEYAFTGTKRFEGFPPIPDPMGAEKVTHPVVDRSAALWTADPVLRTLPVAFPSQHREATITIGEREHDELRKAWKEREELEAEVESLHMSLLEVQKSDADGWQKLHLTQAQIKGSLRHLQTALNHLQQWSVHLDRVLGDSNNEPS